MKYILLFIGLCIGWFSFQLLMVGDIKKTTETNILQKQEYFFQHWKNEQDEDDGKFNI